MKTVKQEPEKEFSFIQEKVAPKRKKKLRRFLISLAATIFLAVVFGVVGRFAFIKSGTLIYKILGMDETERQQVMIPSSNPEGMNSAQTSLTPEPTGTAAIVKPTGSASNEPTGTVNSSGNNQTNNNTDNGTGNNSDDKSEVKVVEKKIDATILDYQNMYSELKKLANTCNYSLATVTAVESGVDWFDDTYETRKSTTGIVIGENHVDMLVLTSLDKVKSADSIEVTFSGTISVEGKLWDYDSDYNLAVIAVELKSIPSQQLAQIQTAVLGESSTLSVGTPILALGNPNGYTGSMELGMITSKDSIFYITDNRLDLFNTDITDNENSDGIIVNLRGEIIGIITHTLKEDLNANINTVIGITKLKPIIEMLANKTDRVYFGIRGEDIPAKVLKEIDVQHGIYVNEVLTDSPAFNAGIRQGDIITMLDDSSVSTINGFNTILNTYGTDDTVKVTVKRMSKQELKDKEFSVTLMKKE